MHPDDLSAGFYIEQYDKTQITVKDQVFTCPIILGVSNIISPWSIRSNEFINTAFIKAIQTQKPQIVILGTGQQQIFPPASDMQKLIKLQINLEIMNTGAACRTFNVIQAEGRNILAGLVI